MAAVVRYLRGMAADSPSSRFDQQLAQLVREHAAAVRGYLLGMVRRADLADELLLDVFERAWQARDRYVEQGHVRGWLLRIADRLAISRLRQLKRESTVDEATWASLEPIDDTNDPAERLVQVEAEVALASALDTLPPNQRRVLLLRYFGNLTFAEIAEQTGWPLGTVLSHCHRGLATLRRRLAEQP